MVLGPQNLPSCLERRWGLSLEFLFQFQPPWFFTWSLLPRHQLDAIDFHSHSTPGLGCQCSIESLPLNNVGVWQRNGFNLLRSINPVMELPKCHSLSQTNMPITLIIIWKTKLSEKVWKQTAWSHSPLKPTWLIHDSGVAPSTLKVAKYIRRDMAFVYPNCIWNTWQGTWNVFSTWPNTVI